VDTKQDDWKEEMLKKVKTLEQAQQAAEANVKKMSAENDALNKEVEKLRHNVHLHAVPPPRHHLYIHLMPEIHLSNMQSLTHVTDVVSKDIWLNSALNPYHRLVQELCVIRMYIRIERGSV